MRNIKWTLLVAALLAGCSRSPEMRVINDAADALGGKSRIEAIKTLTLEGEGTSPNLGQNITPEGDLPIWKVTEFKRTIDLADHRMRTEQLRTAQFLFANSTVQRVTQGLDGDVAYNVNQDGKETRASEQAAKDRRIEMLHHPVTMVRAALEPGAKLTNPREQGNNELVDITTAKGDSLTLAVDKTTHLPASVTSMADQPNLGDVAIVTKFTGYEDVNGVKLPKFLSTTIDKWPQFDLTVSKNAVDAGAADLAASDAVKSAKAPEPPAIVVTAEPVAKGIWWLAGSGNHRSVVFEFDDHLVLFEAPLNEARSKAVIDKARSLRPEKPLTHVVISHHHFDHSGGLRVAVAEGLTVITYKGNVDFFQDLVARKHTIVPDELARNPQGLKIVPVDDELTLKDKSMEVRLYHLKDNPREGTNLFAYVPRDKILVQADLYDSTWSQYPWADNVIKNIKDRKLDVVKDVPVHGEIQSYAEMVKTMKSRGANEEVR